MVISDQAGFSIFCKSRVTKLLITVIFLITFSEMTSANSMRPKIYVDLTGENLNEAKYFPVLSENSLSIDACSYAPEKTELAKGCTSERYLGDLGAEIDVVFFHDSSLDGYEILIVEEARKTALRDGFDVLSQVVEIVLSKSLGRTGGYDKTVRTITLEEARAILTVRILDKATSKVSEVNIVTGAGEHWFLSADLLVTETNQLSLNQETGAVVERETPSKFHLGLNYQLGDLYGGQGGLSDRLLFKVFFQVDSRPLNSYGVGVGYRPKFADFTNFFVAYHRFLEPSEAMGEFTERYDDEVLFGVGFNIDSALKWLQ